MYESFTNIRMNKINVGKGFCACLKRQKKAQALIEYFLIFMIIVSLTIIGVTNLLPKEDEPGVIAGAARNFYNEKLGQMNVSQIDW